jgi:hypothetical protein
MSPSSPQCRAEQTRVHLLRELTEVTDDEAQTVVVRFADAMAIRVRGREPGRLVRLVRSPEPMRRTWTAGGRACARRGRRHDRRQLWVQS